MMPRALVPTLILFCALSALAAIPTAAFLPPGGGGGAAKATGLAVPLPALEQSRLDPLLTSERAPREAESVTAALPGSWQVSWNRLTGTPHRLFGSGLDLQPGGFHAADEVDRVSREFVRQWPEIAGVAPEDLRLIAVEHAAGHWSAIYEQTSNGIPVEGARVDFLYGENGRLVLFGSDAFPLTDPGGGSPPDHRALRPRSSTISTVPALFPVSALANGMAGLPSPVTTVQPELRILPVPSNDPGGEELGVVYHLAYRMVLETSEPPGSWVTWVDASSGEILWRYDLIRYLEIEGVVWGMVEDPGYCQGAVIRPFGDLGVDVSGVPRVFTDASGDYSATVPDASQRVVSAALSGLHVRVNNQGGSSASFSGATVPGTPLHIDWASAQEDERNVYAYVNHAYHFIRTIDGATPLGVLDGDVLANVSINSTCNAFWNGTSLNFYQEGGGCANSGRIGDVVIHEYGHGVSEYVYEPLVIPGALAEGNSDIIATHIMDRSTIGEGFFLGECGSGIRDCDNDLQFPEDVVGVEIHDAGRVICGFDWDVRKALEGMNPSIYASHSDSLWHYTRLLLKPMTMPDQVLGYFFLDDDDLTFDNATPHYDALCIAADGHGFDPPGPAALRPITIAHDPLRSTTDQADPHEVVATITSTAGPIDLSQTRLRCRTDRNHEIEVPMTATGNPDEYRGSIPALPAGTRFSYTITTADDAGNPGAYPADRCFPERPRGAAVFHTATILDELEADSGWTAGVPGDNAVTGIWTRVDPVGTVAQPEDDRTPAGGTMCFVTGQGTPGGPLGENDVDGGRTTLLSPVFDLSAYEVVELLYHRWYSNNTGASPGEDVWLVDVSNDGGNTWVSLENTDVTDHSWKEIRVGLNTVFGARPNQVQVRFIASDLGEGSVVEAGVDDFMLFAFEGPVAVGDESSAPPARFALGPSVPNPFNPSTTIRFELPLRASLSLLVFDARGRRVRTLAQGEVYEAGAHELKWDGRDERGARVSSGVYQVFLSAPGFSDSRKVVMIK